jgi:N-acetylglucosamine kinase-like BadF-type ATPase
MTRYFLGVDGGQSKTIAVIGDENGRVLASGRGGPSNHAGASEGRTKFIKAITTSLGAACAEAGVDAATVRFVSACLGFSGGPADKQALLGEILAADRMLVTDDASIALSGALAGEPGIVVIAGTGSIAFGRNAQGRTARAGGWGYLFGDEGGGFWIAREALRAALGWEEGWGSPTALRAMLLDSSGARDMGVRDINDLMHRCYTPEFPRPRIAALSLLVNYAAEKGDPVAQKILAEAARELARLARAVRSQLFESPLMNARESARCAYTGGVFDSRNLRVLFGESLKREPGWVVTPAVHDPAIGALLEAYRAVGAIPYGIRQRFQEGNRASLFLKDTARPGR